MISEGRLPISSGGGIREPRLPTGAPGTSDGFLGISGFGDLSRETSILGAAGFSSGAFISGTFGAGYVKIIFSLLYWARSKLYLYLFKQLQIDNYRIFFGFISGCRCG